MAEGNKIKSSEVIDENLFTKQIAEAQALSKELVLVVEGLKGVVSANASLMRQSKGESSADLKERLNLIKENKAARLALIETEKVQALNNEKIAQAQLKTDRETLRNSQQKQKETDKEIKLQQQQNSEFAKAQKELLGMKKVLMELKFVGKDSTDEFKKMNAEFMALQLRVNGTKESFGDFHHNVGNYKSGFNGLSNSINQLTREFPAFANSAQTGFMAISNNLPIFFDEISRARKGIEDLRNQGEKVPSLFSQLTSSLFSWGTALTLGVTLLTFFGKEMVIFVENLFKADEAFKISGKTQSDYYKDITKLINEQIEAQLKLNLLNGTMSQDQVDR